jgi:predicted GH43/DUF377 family glycosyl hydrolase
MFKAIGVSGDSRRIILYLEHTTGTSRRLFWALSQDGLNFEAPKPLPAPRPAAGQSLLPGAISALRFSRNGKNLTVTFLKSSRGKAFLYQAGGGQTGGFTRARFIAGIRETAAPLAIGRGQELLFFGDKNIALAKFGNRKPWQITDLPLLKPRPNYFDSGNLTAGLARKLEQGILLTYYARNFVGATLLDSKDPSKLLWRSEYPLWQPTDAETAAGLKPAGETDFKGRALLFLQNAAGDIFTVELPLWNLFAKSSLRARKPSLERSWKNPVLMPKTNHDWESKAAFNPAALSAGGRVHLIYRAIGDDDISTFGYASSADGLHFDERLDYPVYTPRKNFEGRTIKRHLKPSRFASGGTGIGGCEDPRITLINETVFMTYVAFDGCNPPRVALTTITLADFLSHRWNWKEPVLISPYLPGDGNKNSCILPEKINGQYVIFHRIWPDILLDYTPDINFDGKTKFLSKTGHAKIPPRKTHWDSRKVGIGATPIKTEAGWLLIYQAVGHQESNKYKVGAMLLDLQNPSQVIARSSAPVLEPEAWYENEGWKYGVVYPCGAVVKDGDLLVYYGGADMYTCVAKANLAEFLNHLLSHKPAELTAVSV